MNKDGSMSKEKSADFIAEQVMFLCFEIVEPVSMLLTILLFRVMRDPEYIRPLREEIALAQERPDSGLSFSMLDHTPKLGSFTKEVLRVDGPIVCKNSPSCHRKMR